MVHQIGFWPVVHIFQNNSIQHKIVFCHGTATLQPTWCRLSLALMQADIIMQNTVISGLDQWWLATSLLESRGRRWIHETGKTRKSSGNTCKGIKGMNTKVRDID